MTEESLVKLVRRGKVAWLTLNRPAKLNPFNRAMHAALSTALTDVERDPPHVLILTGEGRAFCAGQDLAERVPQIEAGEAVELGESIDKTYNPLIRRLSKLPCLSIAAVNGIAAGAGLGLALASDIVVAAESAQFLLAFGRVGLGPDAGTSWVLPRLAGRSRALGLVLTGKALSAMQAQEWGLVWDVVENAKLGDHVAELANQLAAGSIDAQLAAKALILTPASNLDAQLDRERDLQGALGRTDFYRRAVLMFGTKRLAVPDRDEQ